MVLGLILSKFKVNLQQLKEIQSSKLKGMWKGYTKENLFCLKCGSIIING